MLCWHYRHFKKDGGLCIRACQLVLKTTKTTYLLHDHDKVKGRKLTCFCIDTLVSNSDLLCSVDISHYNALLEAKNIVKGFQIHPFWVCHEQIFLIGWIHNNQRNWIMLSQLLLQNAERTKLIKCDCALMNPLWENARLQSGISTQNRQGRQWKRKWSQANDLYSQGPLV